MRLHTHNEMKHLCPASISKTNIIKNNIADFKAAEIMLNTYSIFNIDNNAYPIFNNTFQSFQDFPNIFALRITVVPRKIHREFKLK